MPGLVHFVDDDASFQRAMERRLTIAGYEVATYASLSICWTACPTIACSAASSWTCGCWQ